MFNTSEFNLVVTINVVFERINMQLLRRKFYKTTRELQCKKIKAAASKNQLIFLEKCFTHDVTPKTFRIKPPIKSQKATRITKEY